MISRFALVGLAVAGLAGPASALATGSDGDGVKDEASVGTPRSLETKRHHRRGSRRAASGDAPAVAGGSAADGLFVPPLVENAAGEAQRSARPRRRLVKARAIVPVLPPLRPEEDRVADPASTPSAPTTQPSVEAAVTPGDPIAASITRTVDVTPPLRPSIGNATTVEADQPSAAAPIVMASLEQGTPPRVFDWIEPAPAEAPVSIVRVLPPMRPAFSHKDPVETASIAPELPVAPAALPTEPAPASATPSPFSSLFGSFPQPAETTSPSSTTLPELSGAGHHGIDEMIEAQARANGIPAALVHRVVIRESRYNPRAIGRGGALGLMQIKHATARALGYNGPPSGLLDAKTNLTYAVKYLAGAYRTADGNFDRAVSYYARGYYYAAKRQGLVRTAFHHGRHSRYRQEADATPALQDQGAPPAVTAPVQRASDDAR